jgi:hypothetical protein
VEGIPDIPNRNQLRVLLTKAISKVWEYLTFPYIVDVLTNSDLVKTGKVSVKQNSGLKKVSIENIRGKVKNISSVVYIMDKNDKLREIEVEYSNGKKSQMKINIGEDGNLKMVLGIEEEYRTKGGYPLYKATCTINYSEVKEGLKLPTEISYKVIFSDIKKDFFTNVNLDYKR